MILAICRSCLPSRVDAVRHRVIYGSRAGRPVQPLAIAAARDLEDPTSPGHRDVAPVRVNELVHGYFTSFANRELSTSTGSGAARESAHESRRVALRAGDNGTEGLHRAFGSR
jgi:hypothetical protein